MNSNTGVSVDGVCTVPDKPFQPHHLSFPLHSFGKINLVTVTFQASCFKRLLGFIMMLGSTVLSALLAARQLSETLRFG